MNSTYKKHSKRKIVLSVVRLICTLATLVGVASFALSSLLPSVAQYSSPFDGLYTDSTQAVDFENAVYRIDESGNVWEESDESIHLVFKKEARLLAVYDSSLYVLANLESVLKSRDITLQTKVHIEKVMFFPVVMYGCESWT